MANTKPSVYEPDEMVHVVKKLSLVDDFQTENALRIIIDYSVDENSRANIRLLGGISTVVSLLSHTNPVIQMLSAWALTNLSLDDNNRLLILKHGAVKNLVPILQSSDNYDVLTKLLWLITNLASDETHRKFLNACGINNILVDLLKTLKNGNSPTDIQLLLEVTKPLRNMLLDLENQKVFAKAGGVVTLVELLTAHCGRNFKLTYDLAEVLLILASSADIMRKLLVAAGILPPLIAMLNRDNLQQIMNNNLDNQVTEVLMQGDLLIAQSLKLLITLSLTEEIENRIMKAGALIPVIDIFHSNKIDLIQQAALLLANLSSSNETIRHSLRFSGLVMPIMQLLQTEQSRCSRGKFNIDLVEQLARLVTNLAMDEINRMEFLDASVQPLLEYFTRQQHYPQVVEAAQLAVNNLNVPVSEDAHITMDKITQDTSVNLDLAQPEPAAPQPTPAPVTTEPTTGSSDNNNNRPRKWSITQASQQQKPVQKQRLTLSVQRTANDNYRSRNKEDRKTIRRAVSVIRPQLLRREKIARELLATEQSYVNSLNIVVNHYLKPLLAESMKDPIIPDESLKAIFSIIEIIAKINGEFLQNLTTRMDDWDSLSTTLGDLLANLTDKLKYYARYINNYDNTITSYANCLKEYPRFAEFVLKVQALPEVRNQDLMSYLIMPIQRIPRYILLLQDMLKNTPEEHDDYVQIETALAKTKEIANFLNEAKRKAEAIAKVAQIQENLIGGEEQIVAPDREFIKEGTLIIREKSHSEYYVLFLFSDLLIFTEKKKQKYKLKKRIPLNEINLEDVADEDDLRNAFLIGTGKDQITVVANTKEEKYDWLTCIMNRTDAMQSQQKEASKQKAMKMFGLTASTQ